MTQTETISRQTLEGIITAAGYDVAEYNVAATLRRIAAANKDAARSLDDGGHPDEFGQVDIETATEWLDETATTGAPYRLCPWL